MHSKYLKFFLSILPMLIFLDISDAQTCSNLLNRKDRLRLAAYNLESFLIKAPKSVREKLSTSFKSWYRTNGVVKAIKHIDADIWLATEVMNLESLDELSNYHLEDAYDYKIVPSGMRGDFMVLFFKRSLNLRVTKTSFESLNVVNPFTKKTEPAFAQNLPIFSIFKPGSLTPDFAIVGTHFKSSRDRSLDKASFFKRTQEADLAVELIKDFKSEFPDTPVISMGDFNTGEESIELNGFIHELGFVDPYIHDFIDPHEMGAITHSFHDTNGNTRYSFPDRVFIDPLIAKDVIQARIHRYRTRFGLIRSLPKSIKERVKNPSDHYPVYFDINI